MVSRLLALTTLALTLASGTLGYDGSRNDNLAVYYGQNSYGAANSNQAGWQKNLASYCQDDTINVFPLAFLTTFISAAGLPEINLANTCSSTTNGNFPGTSLANCQFMASDIKTCQSKGKIVTMSLGGATGSGSFTSDAQGSAFADTIWNLFLGGSSSTRPFGDAVLDGVDFDLEGGSGTGMIAFAQRLRTLMNGGGKKFYLTAAPQCVFPDAYVGSIINAVPFDAVYVQVIYNNWCGLQNFNNANAWNFNVWDNWAKTASPNKSVKVFIGAPASPSAAGSGYVDAATLGNIAKTTRSQFSSFGGVMLWDASQAYGNNRYDVAIKNALGGSTNPTTTTQPTTTKPPTTTTTSTNPGSGSCAGVPAWSSAVAYNGGSHVTYNGHLWTNSWWSQADTPGGAAGVWVDGGACSKFVNAITLAPAAAQAEDEAQVTQVPDAAPTADQTAIASIIASEPASAEAAPAQTATSTADVTEQSLAPASTEESDTPVQRKRFSRLFRFSNL